MNRVGGGDEGAAAPAGEHDLARRDAAARAARRRHPGRCASTPGTAGSPAPCRPGPSPAPRRCRSCGTRSRARRRSSRARGRSAPGTRTATGRSSARRRARRVRTAVGSSRGAADEHERIDEHLDALDARRCRDRRSRKLTSISSASSRAISSSLSSLSSQRTVSPGRSARSRPTTIGQHVDRHALERADDQPADLAGAQRPQLVLGLAQSVEQCDSACASNSSPMGVSSTRRGPPGRSNTLSPTARSSAAICWLIADWVNPSRSAARPNDPSAATACSARSWRISMSWSTSVIISERDHHHKRSSLYMIDAGPYRDRHDSEHRHRRTRSPLRRRARSHPLPSTPSPLRIVPHRRPRRAASPRTASSGTTTPSPGARRHRSRHGAALCSPRSPSTRRRHRSLAPVRSARWPLPRWFRRSALAHSPTRCRCAAGSTASAARRRRPAAERHPHESDPVDGPQYLAPRSPGGPAGHESTRGPAMKVDGGIGNDLNKAAAHGQGGRGGRLHRCVDGRDRPRSVLPARRSPPSTPRRSSWARRSPSRSPATR